MISATRPVTAFTFAPFCNVDYAYLLGSAQDFFAFLNLSAAGVHGGDVALTVSLSAARVTLHSAGRRGQRPRGLPPILCPVPKHVP